MERGAPQERAGQEQAVNMTVMVLLRRHVFLGPCIYARLVGG